MFDQRNRYILTDYQTKAPFSSFLPGIAGEMGVPVWCYYNNRGQAVCSFGVRDKNHAIMEFSPAHVAYRDVSRTGFRTFCKCNGVTQELFTENCDMHIGMSELEITCRQNRVSASAVYFGVPNERSAALARILTVENTGSQPMELELLDGMAAVVPYGLNQDFLKNMTQLAKAWMQAEDFEEGKAYFRVRASLEDSAIVREVKGGNFCLGWDDKGRLLSSIVQPSLIFGEDTSLSRAVRFSHTALDALMAQKQVSSNQFLCCFLPVSATLAPGHSLTLYSLYGQAETKATVSALTGSIKPEVWFNRKRREAEDLVTRLVSPIVCETADPVFDAYARQTYLDNLLRGGTPYFFQNGDTVSPFHLYSRKHGDPEREYNYFSLGQEYFAQGNGNYRDVNQNRRCDVLFAPKIGDYNIHTFFDLIQTDGYNPLVLTPCTYIMSQAQQTHFAALCPAVETLLSGSFTPGQIAMAAEDQGFTKEQALGFATQVICAADSEPNADFGEGYWCDHWTYNLDLIETYLSVYPERKNTLLFDDASYRWYETRVLVNPRAKRYCMTENGLRQYYALDEAAKKPVRKWMRCADGTEARSTLMEKILLLCAVKTATLDAAGMGVEMEGGRPGWYDALNGLPGLLGSSMAESCELARLLAFAAEALEQQNGKLSLYLEIARWFDFLETELSESDTFVRWEEMNRYKETYRAETLNGFSGERDHAECKKLAAIIRSMEHTVLNGIEKAKDFGGGLIPTYFTFRADEIRQTPEGVLPAALQAQPLPLFLEGPVRYLKLRQSKEEKQRTAGLVRGSGLYDSKLKMYKVNESLKNVTFEAGRALAFTPGWLENESVWLHMEYKYLLALLKNGLYSEFSQAFRDAAIPFLNPERYGRSPLENVSFIASGANPDPAIHGRGFVARLSGSTAEFIHIWQILFFGSQPFRWDGKELRLRFDPYLPEYLVGDRVCITCTFLGAIPVTYQTGGLHRLMPGETKPLRYDLTYADGSWETVCAAELQDGHAKAVREGKITEICVIMEKIS